MASPSVVRDMGETLASVLQAALTGMVASANVRIATPDIFHELKPTPQPTCTIFLYRVAVNPAARSEPGAPPEGVSRPLLPVDLSYLITPWAKDPRDEHLMLGRIVQGLHDRAVLSGTDLIGASWAPGDTVRLALETMTMQEQFCIWDTVEMPYRLSLSCVAQILDGIGGEGS
ncbi:DUF4255 domain-containing protein [Roseiarcus sp.]|uniref:DUF4255 domain-containing protein n=1 Tax=Roseiarcus sp. TaxID=1969460 RepID=UPI003C39AF86